MKHLTPLLSLLLLFSSVWAADVVELTEEDFWDKTNEGTWAIEVYAPWCGKVTLPTAFTNQGHCKHLQPVWEDLATKVKSTTKVAKIDGTSQTSKLTTPLITDVFAVLARKLRAKSFPTIVLYV